MSAKLPSKQVLCELEPRLRIALCGAAFILQEGVADKESKEVVWKDRYYYPWIESLLRGYIIYSLRRFFKEPSAEVKRLISAVEALDVKLGEVGEHIDQATWHLQANALDDITAQEINDPVEMHVNDHFNLERS